jgi:Icc-related predicted phosphoesterase
VEESSKVNLGKFKVALLLLFFSFSVHSQNSIPDKIGNWRVEVGPPGNEFYQPVEPAPEAEPPSEEMLEIIKIFAPHTEVKKWDFKSGKYYEIKAQSGIDDYKFLFTLEGTLVEIQYEDDSTKVEEEADKLVLKGSKKSIPINEVPSTALETISKAFPDIKPSQAFSASTIAGLRYGIVAGEYVFYARPDGRIHAADLIKRGAFREIDAPGPEKTSQEIMADLKSILGRYREKFNFENQIRKIGRKPKSPDGSYRFVVMGDSRSNRDLWLNIVNHINLLNPAPDFVINTGDVVVRGYAKEYYDYYIPPLLESEIPFLISIGNHDDGEDGMAKEFRYLFGEKSLNFYFDYGNARYIFIDNVSGFQPYEETLQWLEKTLNESPESYRKYVFTHKPPGNIEKWTWHSWNKANSEIFTSLMTEHKVEHVFLGHIHAYSTATVDGVDYTVTGGGGASLYKYYGPLGDVHNYIICDVQPDGTMEQQVVRFYKIDQQ